MFDQKKRDKLEKNVKLNKKRSEHLCSCPLFRKDDEPCLSICGQERVGMGVWRVGGSGGLACRSMQ